MQLFNLGWYAVSLHRENGMCNVFNQIWYAVSLHRETGTPDFLNLIWYTVFLYILGDCESISILGLISWDPREGSTSQIVKKMLHKFCFTFFFHFKLGSLTRQ